MKLITLFLTLIFTLPALANLNYTAECVRADSARGAELVLYSNDNSSEGFIVLSDGTEDKFNNYALKVAVEANDTHHNLSGPVSALINTQGSSTFDQDVLVTFDLNHEGMKQWIQENTNLSATGTVLNVDFVCKN